MELILSSESKIGNYDITVKIFSDYDSYILDSSDNFEELNYNPLPLNSAWYEDESPFNYTDFALDNFYHNAYFTVDNSQWNDKKRYFVLSESIVDLQSHYGKLGYAKHDSWLKAINNLKSQAKFVQDFFNNEWSYVGIDVTVIETMIDKNGLTWSREVQNIDSSLWGIEWSSYAPWNNQIIDNERQFKDFVPELLPAYIKLTNDQLNTLWENTE